MLMSVHARSVLVWLVFLLCLPASARAAKLRPETLRAWHEYERLTEARIERELASSEGFLVRDFLPESDRVRINNAVASNEIFVKNLETLNEEGGKIKIPKGLVHHWYGAVLVRGASLEDVLAWEQDYDNHASYFDEVEESRLVAHDGDEYDIF
jgi:hypothetical protein